MNMTITAGPLTRVRHRPWDTSGFLALVVALVLALLAATARPISAQLEDPEDTQQTIMFGAHPARGPAPSMVQAAEDLQAALAGPDLGLTRRYLRWADSVAGDPLIDWTLAQGSIPLVSIVPVRPDGSRIAWADIANAAEGEPIYDELIQHATELAQIDGEVWFAFQHEPEIVANIPHGTDDEFIAAYKRFVTEVKNAGATQVKFVWILTAYAFELDLSDRRSAAHWFPGDEWMDYLGADPYNWFNCRVDVNLGWKSFEDVTEPFRDFAAQYPDKPMVVAEFGSVEDPNDPSRKAEWITDIRVTLREPGWEQVAAVLTFNDQQPAPDSDCKWWVDTSPQSLAAYSALVNDELFGGTEGPPDPVDPPGDPTCVAELIGEPGEPEILVSWQGTVGSQVLRRNNAYLATVPSSESSYVDSNPAETSTYVLRLWGGGTYEDLDCGTMMVAPPSSTECSAVLDEATNQVLIDWSDTPELEILRRNNSWLVTPAAGAVEYVDSMPVDGTNSYSLRVWAGGTPTDFVCGEVEIVVAPPECGLVVTGGLVELTWSPVLAGTVVVLRDGAWIATAPNGVTEWSGTEPAGGPFTYALRNWVGGSFTDIGCT